MRMPSSPGALPSFIRLIAMLTSAGEKMSVSMLGLVSQSGSTRCLDVLILYEKSSYLKLYFKHTNDLLLV